MAEHADGSIIVDTEIDPQGFKAGSSELQRAIKSLNKKMEALGPTFQKALSGNASAMSTFDSKAAALEDTISQLEAKMESLGNTRVPTDDYQWLTTEIEKAKDQLMKLEEKQIKMDAMGVKKNSKAWQSLQYDIDLAKRKIADYEGEQAAMRADGTAFQMGSATAEYSQLESALASAKQRLAEMQAQAESARGSTSKLAAIGNTLKSVFSKIGSAGKKAFTGCVNAIKNGVKKMRQFSKASGGCGSAIAKLGKKITGFGSMLKRMALRKLMMGILTAVKDGLNNLAQYSTQTNKDLSTLKSSLTQLKNSFAAAFAPILTVVTPILAKLINYLSTALTYIGKLFAALSGAKTFTKATAVQEDYAASLGKTGQAAEDAQRQLAGFDDLNVLSDSSSKSDSGAGEASPSEMFEEVPIESSITDFIGGLKEAFTSGDYAGIGAAIGNGINTAIQKVNDFIKWDNVGGTITNFVKGVAEGFNSLVHTVNWTQIGDTFAQGFNTAINTLFLILTEFDWPGLAAGLANNLNGVVSGFDWAKLGTTLSTGMRTAIATLRSAITTFDWAALGKGVADGINSIDWVGILSDLAAGISDVLKGALDLLIGFAENLDWAKLGSDLWNSLIGIITNIDWSGIIAKAFRLLGAALAGAVSLIVGFAKSLWESLKSAFESTKNYFATYIDEAGGNVIEGLLNGIWNGIKNIGTWIKDNIFTPFINGFKNAFGIHSPSTVMAEMGGYLIEGLLQGIKNLWHTITDFFSNALASLKQTIANAWSAIQQGAQAAWQGISNAVSSAWSGIKSGVSSACTAVGGAISNAWSGIKSGASAAWSAVSSTVSNAWSGIKTGVSNACTAVKTTASNAWNSIKSTTSTAWNAVKSSVSTALEGAKTAASNAWNSIKTTASTIGSAIKTNVSTTWNSIKSGVSTALEGAKTAASNAWNSIKTTASTIGSTIKTNVTSTWNSVKSSVSTALEGAKTVASTAWNSIKSTASTVCSSVKSTVSSAWSDVKSSVTNSVNNIKSTASSAWNSVKSTVSSVTSSIKSTVSSAWENAKSTTSSQLSSIKSTATSTFTSLKNSATTWGKDVCDNMANGISKAKSTVESAVKGVADKIKSFLGFSEPEDGPLSNFHTYMPDMIDLMTYGIKKNQGQAIGAVSDMASAISSEIQNGDYAMGSIKVGKNTTSALTGFSDKVADSFSSLMDRLQAIADGVTFATPVVAKGSVMPYSVAASTNAGGTGVTTAIEASNDELASVITQVVTNATTNIVNAIQKYSGTTVNFDKDSVASGVIQEINRRTRMSGSSPLVG